MKDSPGAQMRPGLLVRRSDLRKPIGTLPVPVLGIAVEIDSHLRVGYPIRHGANIHDVYWFQRRREISTARRLSSRLEGRHPSSRFGRRSMTPARRGTCALLAAGASSRMAGSDKLLEPVDGVPLIRLLAARAVASGWPVVVTLPPGAAMRRAALAGLDLSILEVPDAATGMAASFRALAQAVQGPLLVMLGDMPEIEAGDLGRMIETHLAHPDQVIRATSAAGRPGQPVLFPARMLSELGRLEGDRGARRLVAPEPVVDVPLCGSRALTDLDTPEAWAAWRRRTGRRG